MLAKPPLSPHATSDRGATAKDKRVLGDALRRALDVNGDGKINFEEYASRFGPRLQMAEARRRRGKQAHPGYQKSQMAGPFSDGK